MKRFVSAIVLPVLFAAGPVLAQSAAPTTQEPSTQPPAAKAAPAAPAAAAAAKPQMPAQVENRIAMMHKRLKITQAQEADWEKFAQAMRDNATSSEAAYQQRSQSLATMTAVENLQAYAQLEQTRAQGVQALLAAFQPLYNDLSPEQKTTVDTMFRRQGEKQESKKAAAKAVSPK